MPESAIGGQTPRRNSRNIPPEKSIEPKNSIFKPSGLGGEGRSVQGDHGAAKNAKGKPRGGKRSNLGAAETGTPPDFGMEITRLEEPNDFC